MKIYNIEKLEKGASQKWRIDNKGTPVGSWACYLQTTSGIFVCRKNYPTLDDALKHVTSGNVKKEKLLISQ
jgi:hypothetical protein